MGITGNDGNCIMCSRKKYIKNGKEVDLGFVGEIEKIDPDFINNLLENDYIPVIATLGTDTAGNIYNINADLCASRVAVSLNALKMVLLTDVDGIVESSGEVAGGRLVSRLSSAVCSEMIENGNINKGMIPKVTSCMEALKNGVQRAHILNGTTAHSILIEIFTNRGIGTMITL
jgi:acetylglutamate kinase